MNKILLMGQANVGKSVFFNRLAGARVAESNYPGTTVDYAKGRMLLEDKYVEIIDVPGTFSLQPKDRAEEVAVKMLEEEKESLVICVIDASKVERGLYLALEIIERGYPVIVALNMWDVAKGGNIKIDAKKLEQILGVPVVPTVAIRGEGFKELVSRIGETKPVDIEKIIENVKGSKVELTVDERWGLVDRITKETVEVGVYEPTLRDAIADITVRPATGIPFAAAVIYGFWAFFGTFAGFFTDGFFVKIFGDHYIPWMGEVFPGKGTWLFNIFVGDPAVFKPEFAGDICWEAGGVFTTGLFMPIAVVLWAVIAFYLVISFLEDIGYLPRLAVLVDTVLHKIGLHGYAIVPTILSLGCNVPGVTACRPLETRKQRFMMMALLGVFIPCGAQIGMMEELVPQMIGFVFLSLIIGYFIVGFILNKIWPGESPEILMDVPPYRMATWGEYMEKDVVKDIGFP